MATAAPHLAFKAQHCRLRHLIWHFRRNLGDHAASFGISPQPWQLRRLLWHFRRNLGDCGAYGESRLGQGERVLLEFVSANPTGPLHVGHGRQAAYGATLANILTAVGFEVAREYYINDAGRQMDILAVSTWLRYLGLCGEELPFPQNGYRGDYVLPLAHKLKALVREQLRRPAASVLAQLPQDAPAGD